MIFWAFFVPAVVFLLVTALFVYGQVASARDLREMAEKRPPFWVEAMAELDEIDALIAGEVNPPKVEPIFSPHDIGQDAPRYGAPTQRGRREMAELMRRHQKYVTRQADAFHKEDMARLGITYVPDEVEIQEYVGWRSMADFEYEKVKPTPPLNYIDIGGNRG